MVTRARHYAALKAAYQRELEAAAAARQHQRITRMEQQVVTQRGGEGSSTEGSSTEGSSAEGRSGFEDEELGDGRPLREQVTNYTGQLWFAIQGNDVLRERVSEWVRFAALLLTIPIGSVANERRFSLMNLIITSLRSSLKEPHANACMRIASSSHTHNTFPYPRVFEIWDKEMGVNRRMKLA